MSVWRRVGNWTLLFIVRPLLQILVFIVISSVVMSLLALAVGFILRTPWHGIALLYTLPGIDLLKQVVVQLPNTLLDGITIGFVYAMIALGYTMVYGVLKFVNFAHSEVFMVGGVVGYEIIAYFRDSKQLTTVSPVLLVVIMILAAMVVSGLLAVAIERLAYKPLRNAPRLVPLIAAIGVSFFLQDFVRAIEALHRNEFTFAYPASGVPYLAQRFTTSFDGMWGNEPLNISTGISMTAIIVIISAIVMLIGLNYFVNGTKLGRAIRALSEDQSTAALMGINVNQMISITFLVGGALGGAAGVLFGLKNTVITPYIGFIPGIKAFTAAVLGGIGNITGALLGGLMLGLLQAFFSGLLPYFPALGTGYSDLLAFAVLILILIFRPAGLLGKRADEKV